MHMKKHQHRQETEAVHGGKEPSEKRMARWRPADLPDFYI